MLIPNISGSYQFKPDALAGMDEEQMKSHIATALNHEDGLAEAYVESGRLRVAIYSAHGTPNVFRKYHTNLSAGQWLTVEDGFPTVYKKGEMLEMRLEAALRSLFKK